MLDRLSSWYRDRSSEWQDRLGDTEVLLALSSTTARSVRRILEQVDCRRNQNGQPLLPKHPWFIHPDLECEVSLSYLVDGGEVMAIPFDPSKINVRAHNPGLELSREDLAEILAYQEDRLALGEAPVSTAYKLVTPRRRSWTHENPLVHPNGPAWQYVPVPVPVRR